MADSDGEYVEDLSDDDLNDRRATAGGDVSSYGTRSKAARGPGTKRDGRKARNGARSRAAWEDIKRSWENVVETEDGSITIEALIEAEKRRRLMRDTTPLQRGIIRHLMLVLDMSFAMAEKDLLPTRYLLTLSYAVEFVREFFEQNPISQMGIVGMRDGIAVRISDMGGNPAEHVEKLRAWAEQQEPQGNPSLQNALEMCRGALFHAPSHGTREVLIIYGALLSSDPGDIHDTITNLLNDRIRVSIVGLAAQVAICEELCTRTNGGDPSSYAVALHEQHFRELFLAATTPPATTANTKSTTDSSAGGASLLMMGFPSRSLASKDNVSLCACHHRPTREGYACTRCRTKVCRLPAECPVCGLTLVLSTHLARSYHHLFPLRGWVEVPWSEAGRSTACFACLTPFPPVPPSSTPASATPSTTTNNHSNAHFASSATTPSSAGRARPGAVKKQPGKAGPGSSAAGIGVAVAAPSASETTSKTAGVGVSESGRYACPVCGNHFCIDCDVYAHETIHNCPGCQSDTRQTAAAGGTAEEGGDEDVDAAGVKHDKSNNNYNNNNSTGNGEAVNGRGVGQGQGQGQGQNQNHGGVVHEAMVIDS